MDLQSDSSKSRFSAYVEALVGVIGHADRAAPLRDYCPACYCRASARAWNRWRR